MNKPQRQLTRAQRLTGIGGVLCFVLILVVPQRWLFTARMSIGGDERAARPGLGASAACLALNLGPLRDVFPR